MVGLCCSGSALSVHWRQDPANSCKKRRRLARCGWGRRESRSVMVLCALDAHRSSPGLRRRPLPHLDSGTDLVIRCDPLRSGRDIRRRARERLPLTAGSSSNGAREAREWIERRGGPTSDSLQLRACIRARPMECRDRETSNRPCWRLLSLAELDNRWQSSKFPRIAKLRAPTTRAPGSTAAE